MLLAFTCICTSQDHKSEPQTYLYVVWCIAICWPCKRDSLGQEKLLFSPSTSSSWYLTELKRIVLNVFPHLVISDWSILSLSPQRSGVHQVRGKVQLHHTRGWIMAGGNQWVFLSVRVSVDSSWRRSVTLVSLFVSLCVGWLLLEDITISDCQSVWQSVCLLTLTGGYRWLCQSVCQSVDCYWILYVCLLTLTGRYQWLSVCLSVCLCVLCLLTLAGGYQCLSVSLCVCWLLLEDISDCQSVC